MATLTISDDQVIQLLEQLPPDRRAEILLRVAKNAAQQREENLKFGEQQMRRLAQARGLNWDAMPDEKRVALVDDIIHEDRQCAP